MTLAMSDRMMSKICDSKSYDVKLTSLHNIVFNWPTSGFTSLTPLDRGEQYNTFSTEKCEKVH